MKRIYGKPLLLTLFILIIANLVGALPVLEELSKTLEFDETTMKINKSIRSILINFTNLAFLVFIIIKAKLTIFIKSKIKLYDYLFLLPALFYLYVFSGANLTSVFQIMNEESSIIAIYIVDKLLGATFEEILFRGIILSLMVAKFSDTKGSLWKSVFMTSLVFGLIHLTNYWTLNMNFKSVINQIYAAFSIGIMWSAIYLKLKNILVVIIIHFISNFFAGANRFIGDEQKRIFVEDSTTIELIFSEVLTLIIFGIPILIGLLIIKSIENKKIEEQIGYASCCQSS